MSLTTAQIMNQVFDAGLITLGAVGISMVSKRALGDSLDVQSSPTGIAKMTAAIATGTMPVHFLQDKKFIPDGPFKKT